MKNHRNNREWRDTKKGRRSLKQKVVSIHVQEMKEVQKKIANNSK